MNESPLFVASYAVGVRCYAASPLFVASYTAAFKCALRCKFKVSLRAKQFELSLRAKQKTSLVRGAVSFVVRGAHSSFRCARNCVKPSLRAEQCKPTLRGPLDCGIPSPLFVAGHTAAFKCTLRCKCKSSLSGEHCKPSLSAEQDKSSLCVEHFKPSLCAEQLRSARSNSASGPVLSASMTSTTVSSSGDVLEFGQSHGSALWGKGPGR